MAAAWPTFELHAIIGLLLTCDFQGWTVPAMPDAGLFQEEIQYALNLEPGVEFTQRTIERYSARSLVRLIAATRGQAFRFRLPKRTTPYLSLTQKA